MAIVNMKKATIIALQDEKESLIKSLQAFGGLHIITVEDIGDDELQNIPKDSAREEAAKFEGLLSQVKYALDFLYKYDNSKKPMFATKKTITESDYKDYLESLKKAEDIYNRCRVINEKIAENRNIETKLNNTLVQLDPWSKLDVPLEDIGETNYTNSLIGFVPIRSSLEFAEALTESEIEFYFNKIEENKESGFYYILFYKKDEEPIQDILKQFGWSKVTLSDLKGTPNENINDIYDRLKMVEKKKTELIEQAEGLLFNIPYLEALFDVLTIEKDKKDIVDNFVKTEKSFTIFAWVPEKFIKGLEESIKKVTDSYILTFVDPKEDEDYPVFLDNPKLVQPAEVITEQYSLPNPRSVDPNKIMAPFYIMFFGMMVSDAVYGIILSALTYIALKKIRLEGGAKKLISLLCLGGISTFIWGALFGGWFGGLIEFRPLWFNPTDDPLKMLIFCLILGIIQLFIGMGMQAYIDIKQGRVLDALFDQGLWYVFLIGLMLLIFNPTLGKYMAIAGAVGLILTQGRSERGIVKKLFSGVLSLYNVTGFLGDVLSYSRLFALGLATGVIGTVINGMSLMLRGSFIGNIFMIVFLIFGHTFNIAINVLGAYVHSSRLQYVEFFGKFFDGDGMPYKPFKVNTKYVEQKN
ncbi:MAG: V-type ATP synthase subunit I [Clostridiales bacterium]|nr:V-type ATP synthase subunit I [Clostridiales bacterium]